ncbi:MAG: glycosyltransferase family 4 protein [Phycisphaerae bacterium]
MKIGFQIEYLDPARGGAETYVYRFAEELLAGGHEVHLFAGGFGKAPEGAVTHRVLRRGLSRWERDLRFARTADRAARRARLDVVVAVGRTFGASILQPHGGTYLGTRRQNLLLIRSAAGRALKEIFDALNPKVLTSKHIEARQFAAEPPPEVVAISRMVRQDMKKFYDVPDERLHLVYNGVDIERFSPDVCRAKRKEARRRFGLSEGETCFLIVAHNFRLKGVRELVEAASMLRSPYRHRRVLVAGRANPRPYQRLAERLGCAEAFQFVGPLADVVPAYAAADVYVQPTWYDPCSLVVLEAMACGRPVVTTRFNGASELMHNGGDGFILDSPDDLDGLADAMGRLLDPDLRVQMGSAARRTAEAHPIERNFREMAEVFNRVAARKEAGE